MARVGCKFVQNGLKWGVFVSFKSILAKQDKSELFTGW